MEKRKVIISVIVVIVGILLLLHFCGRKEKIKEYWPASPAVAVPEKGRPTKTDRVAKAPKPRTSGHEKYVTPGWFSIESVDSFNRNRELSQLVEPNLDTAAPEHRSPDQLITYEAHVVSIPWVFSLPEPAAQRPTTPPSTSVVGLTPDTKPSSTGANLSLKEQKALFYELSRSEYEAAQGGYAQDPSYGENYQQHVSHWNSKYRDATRAKYGITQQQMEEIYRKGVDQGWQTYRS